MKKRHLIIGASAFGISAATHLRRLLPGDDIVCISSEQEIPYNKCFLADYTAALKDEAAVTIFSRAQADEKNISLELATTIIDLDLSNKVARAEDGRKFEYDTLLLGMGSSPFYPPGIGLQNISSVATFHTLADVQQLRCKAEQGSLRKALIIGAGLSGLECADALRTHGVEIYLVERNSHILSHALNDAAEDFLEGAVRKAGVHLFSNTHLINLEQQGDTVRATLSNGEICDVDLVIVATGLLPNSQLAINAGITTDKGYVLVNEYQQTSVPDVYAGGDLCCVKSVLSDDRIPSTLWPDAMLQGLIAAHAIAGKPRSYQGALPLMSSSFFGLTIALCKPLVQAETVIERAGNDWHHVYYLDNDRLKGFTLLGNTHNLAVLRKALLTGESLKSILYL